MILSSLRLENFRQFYGVQEVQFAQGRDGKNITVIHGYNGAGKTALLNAFVWCLYNVVTRDFKENEVLESERAIAQAAVGQEIKVSVSLRFSAGDAEYLVERSRVGTKVGDSVVRSQDSELRMWTVNMGELQEYPGFSKEQHIRQQKINQILPPELYPFFFFNGERVEALAGYDAYKEVEDGIKILLDVKIYERAMAHLRKDVSRQLASELQECNDAELSTAIVQESGLIADEDSLRKRQETLQSNLAAVRAEVEAIEQRQSNIRALDELTRTRSELQSQRKECERSIVEAEGEIARILSEDGFTAFAEPALVKTQQLVSEARQRGELPAKIKPQFVTDLLDQGVCICGNTIGAVEDERLRLWREQVGVAGQEEAISRTSAAVPIIRSRRERMYEEIDRLQDRRSRLFSDQSRIRGELSSIEEQIGDRALGEDVEKLARRRRELQAQEIQLQVDIASCKEKEDGKRAALEQIRRKIKSLEVKDAQVALVRRQKETVERVAGAFEAIFEIQREDVRSELSNRIGQIWQDAAIKDYHASLTETFNLQLTKQVGGYEQPVRGASTGERQVLALSFVGSLVQKAKENIPSDGPRASPGTPTGGEYPLVMDSPFGSLEDDYRAKVAEWIPTLAHQVVVMVSKTQWRNEVESQMRPRIGREYILELHSPKEGASRTISIRGDNFPYVLCSNDPAEQTVIREVEIH